MNRSRSASEPISLEQPFPATIQGSEPERLLAEEPRAPVEKALRSWWLPVPLPAARALMWCIRGGASILQQGFFAGAQFATNILLARWITPASYGVFALAYSIFVLLLAFYIAMVYDPILIFGPGRYSESFPEYIRTLVRAHMIYLPPVCLLVGLAARFLERSYDHDLHVTLWMLAAAAPLLLLVSLCRSALYAQLKVWSGTAAGAGYFALLIGSIWMLHEYGALSPASALAAMGAGSLLVSAGSLRGFFRRRPPETSAPELTFSTVAADHWEYGRWAALTAVAAWVPVNIYYVLLPSRFGLEASAALRALMNLMYPLLHALMSLVTLLVPILVRKRKEFGRVSVRLTVAKLIAIFVPAGLAYLCLLVEFREAIFHFLYHGRYANPSVAVTLCIGSMPITTGTVYLLSAGLRSLERPQLVFLAYLASCLTALLVGVPLAMRYGFAGAATAVLISDIPTIVVLLFCFLRATTAEGAGGTIDMLPVRR